MNKVLKLKTLLILFFFSNLVQIQSYKRSNGLRSPLHNKIDINNKITGTKCNFLSNVISVDTRDQDYDLLMSFSTSEVCLLY